MAPYSRPVLAVVLGATLAAGFRAPSLNTEVLARSPRVVSARRGLRSIVAAGFGSAADNAQSVKKALTGKGAGKKYSKKVRTQRKDKPHHAPPFSCTNRSPPFTLFWSVWAKVADGSAQAAPKHKVQEDKGLKAIQAAKAVTQAKKLGL